MELADHLIVMLQGLVDQDLAEAFGVLVEHLGALFEGEALRAVAAVVRHVAGGLVAHQVDMDVVVIQVLQQVHHVAVIGDGVGLALAASCLLSRFSGPHPELSDFGDSPSPGCNGSSIRDIVHLGNDGNGAGDLRSLALGAAHAAQTGGDEQAAGQVPVVGDAQLEYARR